MATGNTVCLSPRAQYIQGERIADAADILPGHLIEETATGVAVNGTADDPAPRALFADINIGDAGDITRPYTLGETVHYVSASKGSKITARVGESQTIADRSQLASAGDGTLKNPAVANEAVLATALEAVTTGAGETAFIEIEIL